MTRQSPLAIVVIEQWRDDDSNAVGPPGSELLKLDVAEHLS
ncbi:hypothetical protein [Catellatospora sichuanensis]|nr:hypothetical protein [Catellatospora sichuanensis]